MNTSDLFLQVVVPAMTFVLGLYLQRFVRPRRGEIAIVPTRSAILKSDFIDDFAGLKITLDDIPIDTGLGWISGVITVRGTNQIERAHFRKPLMISLPDGWQWRRFYVEPHVSRPTGSIVQENPQECLVEWESLHEREVLRFSALVHSASSDSLRKQFEDLSSLLTVSARVSDARAHVVGDATETKEVFSVRDLPFVLMVAMFGIMLSATTFLFLEREAIHFIPVGGSQAGLSAQEAYRLAPQNSGLCVAPLRGGECHSPTARQVAAMTWLAKVEPEETPLQIRAMSVVLAVVIVLVLLVILWSKYRDYRNHSLLSDKTVWIRGPWNRDDRKR